MGALILGLFLATAACWAVGAYKRLVRLRAEVLRQWGGVDAVWLRLLVRMQGGIAARQSMAGPDDAEDLRALQAASDDLLDALSQARLLPLDTESQTQILIQHQKVLSEVRRILQTGNDALSMRPASWLAKRLKMKSVMRMDLSMGIA
jgi:LemA protein